MAPRKANLKELPSPACPKCGSRMYERILTNITRNCWKCGAQMKAAGLQIGYSFDPEDFTAEEIELARQKGVILNEQLSKAQKGTYLGNTCGSCGALAGDWYVMEDLCDVSIQREEISLGLDCGQCRADKAISPRA